VVTMVVVKRLYVERMLEGEREGSPGRSAPDTVPGAGPLR
jgi:hypothetical protein